MMTEKLVTVFGTRPEIIRLSQLLPKLDQYFEHRMINTYQNYAPQLNDIFVDEFKIRKPDYNLKLDNESFGTRVGDIISMIYNILYKEDPDKLLVLGDTYSCLSVIPAANLGIKIYHMEAGMRSGDWRMPEEKNRRIVDHLANINLPYTENSRQNLLREGLDAKKIFVAGNPIIEVLDKQNFQIDESTIVSRWGLISNDYFLVTFHRDENITSVDAINNLFTALVTLSKKYDKKIVMFAHPRLVEFMEISGIKAPDEIRLRKNIGFFDFANLEKNAFCVISDSGTVPEECAYYHKPCVIVRSSNERPEFVEMGSTIVAGTKFDSIMACTDLLLKNKNWAWNESLGDQNVSDRVLKIIRGVL